MAERPKEMDDFLCEPRVGRFGSVNADGSPHVVPFVFLFDPKEGTFFVSTKAASVTTRNLRRNSSVSVCVDDGEYPFRAVVVNGEAQVSEPTGTDHEAQKKLVDHFYGPDMWAEWVTTPRAREIRIRLTVVPKSGRGGTSGENSKAPLVSTKWAEPTQGVSWEGRVKIGRYRFV